MSNSNYLWGVDLGGTKIEGAVIDRKQHEKVLFRDRIPTEADQGYDHVQLRIKKIVEMMEDAVGEKCEVLGIGTPGAMDKHTGLLKNSNSVVLNHQPFQPDLQKLLKRTVVMANDANCFALAEAKMGAAFELSPQAEMVFGVIMGTGVGGGIVANGKVINGYQGIAGEWGHNFLDESGGICYCGKVGCVEKVLSGPALESFYTSVSGRTLKLKDIIASADADEYSRQTVDRLHHFFGRAIATIINVLDPEVIVIGGGVGNIKSIYTEGVKVAEDFVFNTRLDTHIVPPKLGDSAGVYGAALLTL